jgi:hypothetical protein
MHDAVHLDKLCNKGIRTNFIHILTDFHCFVQNRNMHISKNLEKFEMFTTN